MELEVVGLLAFKPTVIQCSDPGPEEGIYLNGGMRFHRDVNLDRCCAAEWVRIGIQRDL